MKNQLFVFALWLVFEFISLQAFSQIVESPVFIDSSSFHQGKVLLGDTVYEYVDEPAEFPGGIPALRKFIADNLKYPESALKDSIQGKCVVKLLITDKGDVEQVRVTKGVPDCPDCDKEVLRIMALMPKWTPGRVNGKYVSSYYRIPVNFRL